MGTWCHVEGGKSFKMVDSLFPTNVLNRLGFPSSHESTMVLSHQACVSHKEMSRVSLMEVSSLVNKVAPHNSSLGMDRGLTGATLVLAAMRVQVGGCSAYVALT